MGIASQWKSKNINQNVKQNQGMKIKPNATQEEKCKHGGVGVAARSWCHYAWSREPQGILSRGCPRDRIPRLSEDTGLSLMLSTLVRLLAATCLLVRVGLRFFGAFVFSRACPEV